MTTEKLSNQRGNTLHRSSHRTHDLDAGIRREIVAHLTDGRSVPAATALVAHGWSERRARRGDSPSAVLVASAMVFQVGAELAQEIAA